ncbi:1-phosphofructokinase [Lachnoclostridium sp. An14]|uniref:1-phosphofructokinase n=1 Tax=Lachnoclostridium sp. An14 TaxID=1965562 RepID=UPI000B38B19A|nr:1-phosphofructokinase [Lachnoclostridium sp. An14]OUQ21951.1 1-phosphofructokinase [Lachnoclostridium sp. An14]
MIYTVTFNPSLDYVVSLDGFALGRTNRTVEERLFPGGKGINVSLVLRELGLESTALGFTAGFVGQEIERRLEELGLHCDFIPLSSGCSRINVKLKDFDGTEINGMGPEIGTKEWERLSGRLEALGQGDVLVLAGSIPRSLPPNVYGDILGRLSGRGVLTAVDADGSLLTEALAHQPFLVKPNHHELGGIFGVEIRSREEAISYAKRLQTMGAKNVLVSMAGEGAVLADQNGERHQLPAPEGRLVNAVGAGDSMVAGFLAGWLRTGDFGCALRMGLSAGSATAFSEGLAAGDRIQAVYESFGKILGTV